ncbi:MAG: hypothetical protein INF88_03435, partial [Roseomonas sp.]|nr:hypothetical protein [Roseomonas sp.]
MSEDVEALLAEARAAFRSAANLEELELLRVKYLGESGVIRRLREDLKQLPSEAHVARARLLNNAEYEIDLSFDITRVFVEATTPQELDAARVSQLGKSGSLTTQLKGLGAV